MSARSMESPSPVSARSERGNGVFVAAQLEQDVAVVILHDGVRRQLVGGACFRLSSARSSLSALE